MRKTYILALGALAVAAAVATLAPRGDDRSAREDTRRAPEPRAESGALRELVGDLRGGHAPDPDSTDLEERLSQLEARLQAIEGADEEASEPADRPAAKRREPSKLSEAELRVWMDDTLRREGWDRTRSSEAQAQLKASLGKLAGVSLGELECGRRFCRATLTQENGQHPNLSEIFGTPPLTHEGFTINEPDGRVALYFNQPGESLAKLQREALAAAP